MLTYGWKIIFKPQMCAKTPMTLALNLQKLDLLATKSWIQVFAMGISEAQKTMDQTYNLVIKVINSKKNRPIQNIIVTIFRLEKEPISHQQWVENLRNGAPFKRLILSQNTDDNGAVTAELAIGTYEVKIGELALTKTVELTQNSEALIIEPKKHWWK